MGSLKFGHHAVLMLNAAVLLIMITYAYGAATKPSTSSPSSSLMRSEQRNPNPQENGDVTITPYKKGGVTNRKGNSKRKGGNNRKGGPKRKGGSKKNKGSGKKKSPSSPNFTSSCECGKKFTKRIVGGVSTTRNEYPWQAAVFGTIYFCGGTLINDRFVLTAAHCVEEETEPGNVTVRLREHNFNKPDQAKLINMNVVKIIIHKDYDGVTFRNDIALLELDEEVQFPESGSLSPICLPSTTTELYEGKKATATGWGLTDPNAQFPPNLLMEVELKVVSEEACESFYAPGDIRKKMMCAGKRNKNVCFGDSGGPLAYENSEARYEQIGMTSFGLLCGQASREPSVFTRINKYLRWIQRKTRSATYCEGFTFP